MLPNVGILADHVFTAHHDSNSPIVLRIKEHFSAIFDIKTLADLMDLKRGSLGCLPVMP
jgi:hypothetical protein